MATYETTAIVDDSFTRATVTIAGATSTGDTITTTGGGVTGNVAVENLLLGNGWLDSSGGSQYLQSNQLIFTGTNIVSNYTLRPKSESARDGCIVITERGNATAASCGGIVFAGGAYGHQYQFYVYRDASGNMKIGQTVPGSYGSSSSHPVPGLGTPASPNLASGAVSVANASLTYANGFVHFIEWSVDKSAGAYGPNATARETTVTIKYSLFYSNDNSNAANLFGTPNSPGTPINTLTATFASTALGGFTSTTVGMGLLTLNLGRHGICAAASTVNPAIARYRMFRAYNLITVTPASPLRPGQSTVCTITGVGTKFLTDAANITWTLSNLNGGGPVTNSGPTFSNYVATSDTAATMTVTPGQALGRLTFEFSDTTAGNVQSDIFSVWVTRSQLHYMQVASSYEAKNYGPIVDNNARTSASLAARLSSYLGLKSRDIHSTDTGVTGTSTADWVAGAVYPGSVGTTSANTTAQAQWWLQKIYNAQPDIVAIHLGGNDASAGNAVGTLSAGTYTANSYMGNLQLIVNGLRSKVPGALIFILPTNARPLNPGAQDIIRTYNAALAADTTFVDNVHVFYGTPNTEEWTEYSEWDVLFTDFLHGNESGMMESASIASRAIVGVLEPKTFFRVPFNSL